MQANSAIETGFRGYEENTRDMLGIDQPPRYERACGVDGKIAEEEAYNNGQKSSEIDMSGIALAVGHGFSGSALTYVWHARDGEFQVYCEVGQGNGSSLLMDLYTSDNEKKFFIVDTSETQQVSAAEDPGLSAEDAMTVIGALCRFVGSTVMGIEVYVRYRWMGMWYEEWVKRNRVTLQSRNGQKYIKCGSRDPFRYDNSRIRMQAGGDHDDSHLRTNLEAMKRRNETLSRELTSARKQTRSAEENSSRKASGLKKQLDKSRQRVRELENRAGRVEDELERTKESLRASQDNTRRQVSKLNQRVKEIRGENDRLERKMGQVMRENERYQDAQQDFEYRLMEFENFKRAQNKLEVENSQLRDKISVLKSNSRRLDSKFWTKKELRSEFEEIGAEFHLNAMMALQDSESIEMSDEEINSLLWQVLFAVNLECESQFEQMESMLCLNKNKALRNEFMSKIHEYFDELLDRDRIVETVCGLFAEQLGELTGDGAFVKYVDRCTLFCWVMTLKNDPRLEFYPNVLQDDMVNKVFTKEEFDLLFVAHSDCRRVKKAKYVRFLQFVLPGLRRVDDGEIEVYPCVMVEAVKESEMDEQKNAAVPGAPVPEVLDAKEVENTNEGGHEACGLENGEEFNMQECGEHELEPGAPEPMDVDQSEEQGAYDEANENNPADEQNDNVETDTFRSARDMIWANDKKRLEDMLSEGDVALAFGILRKYGLDVESKEYILTLTCHECRESAGKISSKNPDDDYGCVNDARHTDVDVDNLYEF